jgi:D-serine deaminase-like pyridoxal phosphate-dependent protein
MSAGQVSTSDALSENYFKKMTQALCKAGLYTPSLVVDKVRLDSNLAAVKSITEKGFDFRIVVKSLPSIPMLEYIMKSANTQRLMCFHMPFLRYLSEHIPNADVLMGKPMPIGNVESYYQFLNKQDGFKFNPTTQLQWLTDSYARVKQYGQLAKKLKTVMRINLELDVGLHRGGFTNHEEFSETLNYIKCHDYLTLSGMMGYEAHITKIPGFIGGPIKAFNNVCKLYKEFSDVIIKVMGSGALDNLTLNTGGSSTYPLYEKPGLMNEISTASALVKPTDFDVYTLDHHVPAAFIATPVLKIIKDPELPMVTTFSKLMHRIGLLPRKVCFIYGGNWLAKPCYPAGSKRANILGHSSNQEMYELKETDNIDVDDFMFFRPTQSEAVFLQFGDIAVYEDGKIVDMWPVFTNK